MTNLQVKDVWFNITYILHSVLLMSNMQALHAHSQQPITVITDQFTKRSWNEQGPWEKTEDFGVENNATEGQLDEKSDKRIVNIKKQLLVCHCCQMLSNIVQP